MKNSISILILLLLTAACGKKTSKKEQTSLPDDIISVKTEAVQQAMPDNKVVASGMVASLQEARLSFKTGGVIERIYVKEGDKVTKGQLLASLNLTEINAGLAQVHESVKKAERDLQRVTNLYKDSVATLEQVQNLTTALNVAKQNYQTVQFNRSYSQIHASITGTIIKKIMNEGELAGPGSPVFFVIGNAPADWVMRVGVTDREWARLSKGAKARVSLDAFPNQNFDANISNLAQVADPSSGMYQIELKLQPAGQKLATGLFGKASIEAAQAKSMASISVNALIEGNDNQGFVYYVEGERAKKIPVIIDHIDGKRVYLQTFPAQLDQVITDGSAYLTDGSKVKILK